MAQELVKILRGDTNAKIELGNISSVYKNNLKIKQTMQILDQMINAGMEVDWWYAMNEQEPVAIILTINRIYTSQLSHFYVSNFDNKEDVVKRLFEHWLAEKFPKYLVDLNPDSKLIPLLRKLGFKFNQTLFHIYDVNTDYIYLKQPDSIIIRAVEKDDLKDIYNELIKPNILPGSPIYLTKEQFLSLAGEDPSDRNWLVVTDLFGGYLGFGGSPPMQHTDHAIPIVYGPYTSSYLIEEHIIAEFMNFWKMKGYDRINIIRTKPIHHKLKEKYGLFEIPEHSIIRFVK
ncbi:MAG: hypothetical protein INQ03_20760 [Candidatus Heimdallarchaeota archaeon]|nr:hypothetical protein [Candidatus Heimdallarchaeota archaeon]